MLQRRSLNARKGFSAGQGNGYTRDARRKAPALKKESARAANSLAIRALQFTSSAPGSGHGFHQGFIPLGIVRMQGGFAHQVQVNGTGSFAAFMNRPDHQGLATPCVTGDEVFRL